MVVTTHPYLNAHHEAPTSLPSAPASPSRRFGISSRLHALLLGYLLTVLFSWTSTCCAVSRPVCSWWGRQSRRCRRWSRRSRRRGPRTYVISACSRGLSEGSGRYHTPCVAHVPACACLERVARRLVLALAPSWRTYVPCIRREASSAGFSSCRLSQSFLAPCTVAASSEIESSLVRGQVLQVGGG